MARIKFDDIDLRILRDLQDTGRMSNVRLARRAGISPPPCLRRVRALEATHCIRGYHADIDPAALGFGVTVFANVGLHSQAEADLIAFEQLARSWAIVRDCYMLSGEIDFILRCVAPDLNTFQALIIDDLTTAPNVASVKTSLVIRASKHELGAPLDLLQADRAIMVSSHGVRQ